MSDGADVDLKLGGQEVSIKNVKSLNTLATLATLVLVILIGYAFWEHKTDDRDNKTALISTLREMATSQRVTNCLMAAPPNERGDLKLAQCERIAR